MKSKTVPLKQKSNINKVSLERPPYEQFIELYQEALRLEVPEANAMTLATVSASGQASSRIVLLKTQNGDKLTFFTNYNSQKAQEISANPKVSLLFFWQPLAWQVRIQGTAVRSSRQDSEAYFRTRARDKQIGAWASAQSSKIKSYDELQAHYENLLREHEGKDVPCPEHWGGFDITPHSYEFWFGREARLHERYCFVKNESGWDTFVKAP